MLNEYNERIYRVTAKNSIVLGPSVSKFIRFSLVFADLLQFENRLPPLPTTESRCSGYCILQGVNAPRIFYHGESLLLVGSRS